MVILSPLSGRHSVIRAVSVSVQGGEETGPFTPAYGGYPDGLALLHPVRNMTAAGADLRHNVLHGNVITTDTWMVGNSPPFTSPAEGAMMATSAIFMIKPHCCLLIAGPLLREAYRRGLAGETLPFSFLLFLLFYSSALRARSLMPLQYGFTRYQMHTRRRDSPLPVH